MTLPPLVEEDMAVSPVMDHRQATMKGSFSVIEMVDVVSDLVEWVEHRSLSEAKTVVFPVSSVHCAVFEQWG